MTHVRSSASFLAGVRASTCPRVSVLRIHEMFGLTCIQARRSPIDIDGEWRATMRRLIESRASNIRTRERAIRCARISISIDIYARPGVFGPPAEKGRIPLSA